MYIIGKTGVTGPWASPESSRSRQYVQLVPCFLFDERLDVRVLNKGSKGVAAQLAQNPGTR
jgi:hypothetical protein